MKTINKYDINNKKYAVDFEGGNEENFNSGLWSETWNKCCN